MSAPILIRVQSVDMLRGLVVLLMTLGHVRGFFYSYSLADPMTLSSVDTAMFFTRWLTNFCVPIFLFLAGISIYLYAQNRNLSPKELATFLIKRGIFLIMLE